MTHFKKTLSTLGVCAALVMAAQANAATETTLKVTGTIVPAACSPSLSNAGEISFGSIAAASIDKAVDGNSLVQLGSKDVTLTISCEANAAVGFKMIDNRASSTVTLSSSAFIDSAIAGIAPATQDYFGFGLGLASNDAKIGAYTVMVDSSGVTADGESVDVILSDDEGKNWRAVQNTRQVSDNKRIVTVAAKSSTLTPKMFKEATLPLKISAGVQTSSVLGGDEVTLDGNATLSLVYL